MIKALQDWIFDWWLESVIYNHLQNQFERKYGKQKQHGQLWHNLNPEQIKRMKFRDYEKPRLVYIFNSGK